MPVTHGVTGSSPVRTASPNHIFDSGFFYYINQPSSTTTPATILYSNIIFLHQTLSEATHQAFSQPTFHLLKCYFKPISKNQKKHLHNNILYINIPFSYKGIQSKVFLYYLTNRSVHIDLQKIKGIHYHLKRNKYK